MKVFIKKIKFTGLVAASCLLAFSSAHAATVVFPGVTAPYTITSADTLNVQSGTMATTNNTNYTVQFPTTGVGTDTTTLTINAGATLSYAGSNSGAIAIQSIRNDIETTTETINNNGTINSGTGASAIYAVNSVGATADNIMNIHTTGNITGSIYVNGVHIILMSIRGSPTISGDISLIAADGGTSRLKIGFNDSTYANTTFSTGGIIQGVDEINVLSDPGVTNATFNINHSIINFGSLANGVGANTNNIINLNTAIFGRGNSIVINYGTINLSADINGLDVFAIGSATAQTNILQQVTIYANTFGTSGSHQVASVMTDVLNYGNLSLPIATTVELAASFALTYAGGYFPGGTYTLLSAALGIDTPPTSFSKPDSTLFLVFGMPEIVNSNTVIQTTLTRTPFQTFASSSLTSNIGTILEYLGTHNPSASTVTLLNAVERSTTASGLQNALAQLAPSVSAGLHTITVQNETMEQVEFRLANVRTKKKKGYNSGATTDVGAVWLRPFGDIAEQKAIDDISGYDAYTGGFSLGTDRVVSNQSVIGAALSYAYSHVKDKANSASAANVKSYQAMLYGSYYFKRSKYLDWTFAAASNDFNAGRHIDINGFNTIASAKYNSQQYAVRGIWGKNYNVVPDWQLVPEALLQYSFSNQHSYNETGAGAANLLVDSYTSNLLVAGVGGRATTSFGTRKSTYAPEIHGMLLYNIINGNQTSIANFAAGGTNINTDMNLPRLGLKIGAAFTWIMGDNSALKINYDYTVRDKYMDNAVYVNFKYIL